MSTELQSIIFPKSIYKNKSLVDEYLTKNNYPKKTIKSVSEPIPAFQYEIRPTKNLIPGTSTNRQAGNVIFIFGRTGIAGHKQPAPKYKKSKYKKSKVDYSKEIEMSPDMGSGIQSVLIPKKWGKPKAKEYLKKNDYSISYYGKSPYTQSENFLRYRQTKPNKNSQYITKKLNNGVNIVIQR